MGNAKDKEKAARRAARVSRLSAAMDKVNSDDVFLGVWQHFITAIKIGAAGSIIVNSCSGAIQPPAEVNTRGGRSAYYSEYFLSRFFYTYFPHL